MSEDQTLVLLKRKFVFLELVTGRKLDCPQLGLEKKGDLVGW